MDNICESDKVSILFLRVFKNVYLRNLIFYHLQNMKIPFKNFSDNYLGNRISFTLIKSLSWLSKRNQWSLLKDKLNNNEELIIKKNSISTLLNNCKDIDLLKLIYSKKQDQLNQIDLVYQSIESNNFKALQLFSGSFGNEFKVPTDNKPLDKAISLRNIQFIEYLLENRDEGYTKQLIFKNQTDESFIKYILNNSKLYNGEQSLISFSQFLNLDHLSINLQIELVDKKLVYIDQNLIPTVRELQSKYCYPTLLSKPIEYYLKSSYSLNSLYGNTHIGDCLLFQIFKEKNLKSLLEFLENKNILSNIWNLKLDWSVFKENPIIQFQLINGIIEFENTTRYSQNLNQVIAKLYPITFITTTNNNNKQEEIEKEETLINQVMPLYLKFCKMGIENADLIIKSFYQLEIANNCNIQLFDKLISILKSNDSTNEKRIGYILYGSITGVGNTTSEYNYFGSTMCNPELIKEFLDRCLEYKEFNFNFKSFYTNLKNSLNSNDYQQLYLDILIKLKLKLNNNKSSLMNNSVIELFNQTNNISIKIQIVGSFLNQFNTLEISLILNELMGINKDEEEEEESITNSIIDIFNQWDGKKLKFNIQTLNLKRLNKIIENGSNGNIDLSNSIDYLISNCNTSDDQLPIIKIIKKLIQFQIKNNIYQLKPIEQSSTEDQSFESIQFLMDEPSYLISYIATTISLNRNLFEILNCLHSIDFQHLFYWDNQLFSNPPILPLQPLQSTPPPLLIVQEQKLQPQIQQLKSPIQSIDVPIKKLLINEINEKGSNVINTGKYQFKSYQFKDDLSKLLSYGQFQDVLYYFKMDKLESKTSRLVIQDSQILKIIKTCKYEIVIEYLNIYLNEPYLDPSTISQCLFHSLKNNRFDIYEYLFSTLNPLDDNKFGFIGFIQKIGAKGAHIPIIKYIFSSDIFINSSELQKRTIISNLFRVSLQTSNFQLFKWLVSPSENIYYHLINNNILSSPKEYLLKHIKSLLTPNSTISFLNNVENYYK